MPALSLAAVEPGYVREARVAAADKEMVNLTAEFVALGPSAQTAARDRSNDAIAVLRDEQARPAGNDVEGYSEWLAEQMALNHLMNAMYYPSDGGVNVEIDGADGDDGDDGDDDDDDDVLAYVPSSPNAPDPTSEPSVPPSSPAKGALRLDRFGRSPAERGGLTRPAQAHPEANGWLNGSGSPLAAEPLTEGSSLERARGIFAAVDKDATGSVDRAELRAHVVAHLAAVQGASPATAEASNAAASTLFEAIDAEKDGRIAVAEWVRAFVASELHERWVERGSEVIYGVSQGVQTAPERAPQTHATELRNPRASIELSLRAGRAGRVSAFVQIHVC